MCSPTSLSRTLARISLTSSYTSCSHSLALSLVMLSWRTTPLEEVEALDSSPLKPTKWHSRCVCVCLPACVRVYMFVGAGSLLYTLCSNSTQGVCVGVTTVKKASSIIYCCHFLCIVVSFAGWLIGNGCLASLKWLLHIQFIPSRQVIFAKPHCLYSNYHIFGMVYF